MRRPPEGPFVNAALDEARACVLVVDLDGTMTPTDTLVEGVLHVARQRPAMLPRVLWAMREGRAAFKSAVTDAAPLPADGLPYREDLVAYLQTQRSAGRRVVLATAADQRVADAVSAHLRVFNETLGTRDGHNLKGEAKLAAIRERFGDNFEYVGDSRADLPVWRGAKGALLAGRGSRFREQVEREVPVVAQFGEAERPGLAVWARALRLHQWLKNVLVFVPLVTGDTGFGAAPVVAVLMAFLAFSLLASATYIVNDLLDLPSDRRHPRKRHRPLAAAKISIRAAVAAAAGCLAAALGLALMLPEKFGLTLLAYWILTTAYSTTLKRYVLLDVMTLAVLYTTRIIAGAAVLSIAVSPWLLAFSATVFLSLALVKRSSELITMSQQGRRAASGRDYNVTDLPLLQALGSAAAVSAVVVFGLFISQPSTLARYAQPDLLWGAALALAYWLGRIWIKTGRGEMHDDPLVYTLSDRGCRLTLIAILAITLLARFPILGLSA